MADDIEAAFQTAAKAIAGYVANVSTLKVTTQYVRAGTNVDDVDFSAGAALASLMASLAAKGVNVKFMRPSPAVRDQLRRYGVLRAGQEDAARLASVRDMRHRYDGARDAAQRDAGSTPEERSTSSTITTSASRCARRASTRSGSCSSPTCPRSTARCSGG